MKKTLLSLGTLVSTIAPVASVIACGDGDVPGHEAPYSITIQADGTTTTQANIFVDPKGFISNSYIKEIKSRIAESIVAANKDTLKYSTFKLYIGDPTIKSFPFSVAAISAASLTETNKNDLDTIYNFIDSSIDSIITNVKSNEFYKQYFQKEIWENQHHQIEKANQDEIKKTLLKYLGFTSTDPKTIDVKYKIVSDKFLDVYITRTNVVSSPELHTNLFTDDSTEYPTFTEGDTIRILAKDASSLITKENVRMLYITKKTFLKAGVVTNRSLIAPLGSGNPQNAFTQLYKIIKFLLTSNGYDNGLLLDLFGGNLFLNELRSLGDSVNKVFGYEFQGRTFGINYDISKPISQDQLTVDFDKKTFKIKKTFTPHNQNQWIFGKNGKKLAVEPSREWTMEFEGTYELNNAGSAVETITSLTKAIATYGTDTIDIIDSSAKIIARSSLNHPLFFIDK